MHCGSDGSVGANIESQDRVIECLSKITESSRHLLGADQKYWIWHVLKSGKMTLAQEDFQSVRSVR